MASRPVVRHVRVVAPRYSKPYPVIIGEHLLENIDEISYLSTLLDEAKNCLIAYQDAVEAYALRIAASLGKKCKVVMFKLVGGESSKTLDTVLEVVTLMHRYGFSRRDVAFIIGGGAASDTVGFAAAVYKRGIRYVNVPTTLLAMIDAAIGGKVAVNYMGLKNLLGAFYQPSAVLEDLVVLSTLPEQEFVSACGEVLKYALTLEEGLAEVIAEGVEGVREKILEVIKRSVEAKARIVEMDEREEFGIREVLNYGHTVGHAIEEAYRIPHGVAVAWGCLIEAVIGEKLGYTPQSVVSFTAKVIQKLGLKKPPLDPEVLIPLMKMDKKVYGDVIMAVYSVGLGRAVVIPTRLEEYARAAREALREVESSGGQL